MANPAINDKVWRALQKKIAAFTEFEAKVGILASKDAGVEHNDDGITMVELATIHEFGDGPIPERSFIRATFQQNEQRVAAVQAKLAHQIIEDGKPIRLALEELGQWGAAEVKKHITAGDHIPPPLKPQTVEAKGSDRPLADTGQLVSSIAHEVVLK